MGAAWRIGDGDGRNDRERAAMLNRCGALSDCTPSRAGVGGLTVAPERSETTLRECRGVATGVVGAGN